MKKPTTKHIGIAAIAIATASWGFDGVVLTPRLYNLNVGFVVFLLHALPFLLMNLFLFSSYRALRQFTQADWATIFLIALFGGSLGTLAIVKAMFLVNFQSLSVVVLLQKLQPIFAISFAAILLQEKISRQFVPWALLALVGSYFLTFGWNTPNIGESTETTYAALLALLAAFSFGISTVLGRRLLLRYHSYTITFFRYGFTALLMVVYMSVVGLWANAGKMTEQNWLIVLVIIFTTGSAAIFLYYFGLRRIPANVATMVELCFPLSAILFDYLFNDQLLKLGQWLGAALLIFSIVKISLLEVKKTVKNSS